MPEAVICSIDTTCVSHGSDLLLFPQVKKLVPKKISLQNRTNSIHQAPGRKGKVNSSMWTICIYWVWEITWLPVDCLSSFRLKQQASVNTQGWDEYRNKLTSVMVAIGTISTTLPLWETVRRFKPEEKW